MISKALLVEQPAIVSAKLMRQYNGKWEDQWGCKSSTCVASEHILIAIKNVLQRYFSMLLLPMLPHWQLVCIPSK